MLCSPTNVAAASCQALLPVSSHLGDGTSIGLIPWFFPVLKKLTTRCPDAGSNGRLDVEGKSHASRMVPPKSPVGPRLSGHRRFSIASIAHKLGKRAWLASNGAAGFAGRPNLGMDRRVAM